MSKVRFVGNNLNKVVEIKVGSLILDSALASGVDLPYGCRYGSCYACMVEVLKGIENIDYPPPINKSKNTILTCISKIKKNGDITLKV